MESGFSLGSNLGDRRAALAAARDALRATPGARLLAQSPIYETTPVGVRPEYRDLAFYNAVVLVESDRDAAAWLQRVETVERALGRVRGPDRFAPRPIDIDLLYCGDACIDSGGLVVPHPRWAERRFVVQPLADVRPDLVLPGAARTVREVLDGLAGDEAARIAVAADAW